MFRCPACGFCAVQPTVRQATQRYEEIAAGDAGSERKNLLLTADYLAKIAPHLPNEPFRFLEVGGAYGYLAERVSRECQSEVLLLEPSPAAVKAAKARGVNAETGSLESFTPPQMFDVVCAAHVIEHVADARAFLLAAARVLKPGGTLLLLTPNASAWKLALTKRAWAWAVPLEHTLFFSQRGAEKLLPGCGFSTPAVQPLVPSIVHYPFFLIRWLAERRTPPPPSTTPAATATAPRRGLLRRLSRLVVWAEFLALRFVDFFAGSPRRDELLIIARKL